MSERTEKVNSLLEHEISGIMVKHFRFPDALVTLTHVETTGNLIEAKAYISAMPEDKLAAAVAMLNRNVANIQQKLNKLLNMRPVPKIIFVPDRQPQQASKVEELLAKLKKGEK